MQWFWNRPVGVKFSAPLVLMGVVFAVVGGLGALALRSSADNLRVVSREPDVAAAEILASAAEAEASRTFMILAVDFVIGAALCAVLTIAVNRRVRRSIADLRRSIDQLAAGDLTHDVALVDHDELGSIIESVNGARAALRSTLTDVVGAARTVAL